MISSAVNGSTDDVEVENVHSILKNLWDTQLRTIIKSLRLWSVKCVLQLCGLYLLQDYDNGTTELRVELSVLNENINPGVRLWWHVLGQEGNFKWEVGVA